jgi:hypothetical protein
MKIMQHPHESGGHKILGLTPIYVTEGEDVISEVDPGPDAARELLLSIGGLIDPLAMVEVQGNVLYNLLCHGVVRRPVADA